MMFALKTHKITFLAISFCAKIDNVAFDTNEVLVEISRDITCFTDMLCYKSRGNGSKTKFLQTF
jgi:hypothetical protein